VEHTEAEEQILLLIRMDEEALAKHQNRFVEKQREADEEGEPEEDGGDAGGT
jgi:hypothetical protein